MSIFNSIINSIDKGSNNEIETDSIRNYEQNEKYLFETLPEIFINPTEEKINQALLKIFSINNLAENNHASNRYFPSFIIEKQKKRGRQTKNMKKPQHLKTDSDNLQRKIQIHFFTFIVNLSNDAIKTVFGSKTSYNFKQVDYKFNNLHKLAIKDILKMKISPKNKKYSRYINQDILNAVCNRSKLLENFFNINYLEFFNDFYFNEEKETTKIVFEEIEIPFSKKTKNFYHLLKKYENYKTLLIDSVKSVYFYGYDTLISKNSFLTSKKDIELKESDN